MRKPVMHSIWLVLILSVLSSRVSAGTLGDLTYEIADGEVTITKAREAARVVNVPAYIEGLPVTKLGVRSFWDAYHTSVTLPETLREIGDEAFLDAFVLPSIDIPASVKKIGLMAFAYCDILSSITIPENVEEIGESAFVGCAKMTNVVIASDKLREIPRGVFTGCTSLASIKIPDRVTSIGKGAFERCSALTSITIPNSVTSIDRVFTGCTSLASINIPDSVTSIDGAFTDCTSLTSVNIPDSVTSIDGAFQGCTSLTSVNIPDSVRSINMTFYGCKSLDSITIPLGVESIGRDAFTGCTSLTSISIPVHLYDEVIAERIGLKHIWPDGFRITDSEPIERRQAIVSGVLANGFLIDIEIIDGGSGYKTSPEVKIDGGGGFDAFGIAIVEDGAVASILMINAGRGYTSVPEITIEPPTLPLSPRLDVFLIPQPIETAEGKAILANGFVVDVEISNQGRGFRGIPKITFLGGGGTGASGVAIVENGHVTSIEILSAGKGYTSTPAVKIESPQPSANHMIASIAVSGEPGQLAIIESTEDIRGPWSKMKTILIGELGRTDVDLDEGAEKRFYRVRD